MRPALIASLALVLLTGASAPRVQATASEPARATKPPHAMLGILERSSGSAVLARYDPLTLRDLPGRKVELPHGVGSWTFSAGRSSVAIASCQIFRPSPAGIRIVKARTMRVLVDLRLASVGCATALTWLRANRLLVVESTSSGVALVVVDPVARAVVQRAPLPSWPRAVGRTRDELVLLLQREDGIGPARLAVADAEGTVRIVTVERIREGAEFDEQNPERHGRTIAPGLAVDPDGRRAFLVPASGDVARVDLRTLAVDYHELGRPSLLGRLAQWLFPEASAKLIEGPERHARWLGDGMIAVSGVDYTISESDRGQPTVRTSPAGVRLIDTRTWSSRVLEETASADAAIPGGVAAHGGRWDSVQRRSHGPGVVAFDLQGRERWRLDPGEYRWLIPAGSLGYVEMTPQRIKVVDLATGTTLRTIRLRSPLALPGLLGAQASSS